MSEPPRCFISYSWEGDEHSAWVRKLATRLRECGVDAILDQFHCAPGTDLTRFMERSIRESDFVLLVCTPTFARKADAGAGGVGFEKAIVTGEIFAGEQQETKFVPVLRHGDAKEALPSYLKSRLFVDFREDASFQVKVEELLRHFYGEPLYQPPPIGPRPSFKTTPPPSVEPPTPKRKRRERKLSEGKPREVPSERTFTNSLGMKFVLIPAGTFMMGSPRDEQRRYVDDKKQYDKEHWVYAEQQHAVTISKRFYLQTTQVTQGQWKRIMKDNPSHFKECGEDCPVENIVWKDIQAFISKLNEVEGGEKYRLPTEAEWEYACRAGSTAPFCFGDDEAELGKYAWYRNNSGSQTHPVGQKKPNAWGLYDMHGNVYEWCQDWFTIDYPKDHVTDPAGPGPSDRRTRVSRGGSWNSQAWAARSASRMGLDPQPGGRHFWGFRLARDS